MLKTSASPLGSRHKGGTDDMLVSSIPPPDYSDYDSEDEANQMPISPGGSRSSQSTLGNPLQKRLSQEIKRTVKTGQPLLKKTEFEKELDRRTILRQKREMEEIKKEMELETDFAKKLGQRAERLRQQEEAAKDVMEAERNKTELERVHDKIKCRSVDVDENKSSVG